MRKDAIKVLGKDMPLGLRKAVLQKDIKDNEQATWNKHEDVEIEKHFHHSFSLSVTKKCNFNVSQKPKEGTNRQIRRSFVFMV
tara:strand:+ start:107 stop:355 length:249 start_codon:yes stop_codon:yes gene_type:complete